MTIFLAGHETTANALTWTWYLLSQAPGRRAPAARGDRPRARRAGCRRWPMCRSLPYVEQVVTESMRLYPPAWLVGRRADRRIQHRRLRRAAALDRRDEPVDRAARSRGISRARAVRSRSLDAGVQGGAAARSRTFRSAAARASASASRSPGWSWCCWSPRSRSAGGSPGARPPGRAAGRRDAAAEARDEDDGA